MNTRMSKKRWHQWKANKEREAECRLTATVARYPQFAQSVQQRQAKAVANYLALGCVPRRVA